MLVEVEVVVEVEEVGGIVVVVAEDPKQVPSVQAPLVQSASRVQAAPSSGSVENARPNGASVVPGTTNCVGAPPSG
jgi:hypothetical protein